MGAKLSKYIIPSVIAMAVVGTNTNIDGFFIGNILGDPGLAAINIVWPIVAFIVSVGTGIGVGGSVLFNCKRGSGRISEAESVKNTTLIFLILMGLLFSIIFPLVSKWFLILMGAEDDVLDYAVSYAVVIGIGAVFQVAGAGLLVMLRNCGKTYHAMIYSFIGFVLHLVLDVLLAGRFQMAGVAAATVISQAVVSVLGIFSLKLDRTVKPQRKTAVQIIKSASAPFGLNFVPSLVLLYTNHFALEYGGVAAVSAYAVMSYAVYTFDYIFQGVCDGVQPVISYCIGAGDEDGEKYAMKHSAFVLLVFSFVFCMMTPLMMKFMPMLFSVSNEAKDMMDKGFMIYALSYPCKAAVKFVCSYYYSCGRTRLSNILVYLDPFLLTPGLLFVMSAAMGVNGVWGAMTLSQLILAVIGITVLFKTKIGEKGKEKNYGGIV